MVGEKMKVIEEWKPIKGYENLYEVSNLGNVRSLARNTTKGKILKQFINNAGYLQVQLSYQCKSMPKRVHRLVAEVFIPNQENKPCVNHKDGNKLNNRIDNLEWVTKQENVRHAWKSGLCENARYTLRNHYQKSVEKFKKRVKQYDLEGNFIEEFSSLTDAAKKYNIHPTNIKNACKGIYKKSCGYIWKYADK